MQEEAVTRLARLARELGNAQLRIIGSVTKDGSLRWACSFDDVEINKDGKRQGLQGLGSTPDKAMEAYAESLASTTAWRLHNTWPPREMIDILPNWDLRESNSF